MGLWHLQISSNQNIYYSNYLLFDWLTDSRESKGIQEMECSNDMISIRHQREMQELWANQVKTSSHHIPPKMHVMHMNQCEINLQLSSMLTVFDTGEIRRVLCALHSRLARCWLLWIFGNEMWFIIWFSCSPWYEESTSLSFRYHSTIGLGIPIIANHTCLIWINDKLSHPHQPHQPSQLEHDFHHTKIPYYPISP